MMMARLFILALLALSCFGQSAISPRQPVDLSAVKVKPFQMGTLANRPATCETGMIYWATDGINGRRIFECSATNVWTSATVLPTSVLVLGTDANGAPNAAPIYFLNTYEEVAGQATGSAQKILFVKASSQNGGAQTIYTYDGNGGIYWVASVRIN